jgi:hypothetical protein
MDWGFLSYLIHSKELELIDELFIELHFYNPDLGLKHQSHTMQQQFDVLRQLRECGLPIHAWP